MKRIQLRKKQKMTRTFVRGFLESFVLIFVYQPEDLRTVASVAKGFNCWLTGKHVNKPHNTIGIELKTNLCYVRIIIRLISIKP